MNCLISFQLVIRQFPLIKKQNDQMLTHRQKIQWGASTLGKNVLALTMVAIAWQIFRGLLGSVGVISPLAVYLPG